MCNEIAPRNAKKERPERYVYLCMRHQGVWAVMRLIFLATGSLNLHSNSKVHCYSNKNVCVNEVLSSCVAVIH